MRRQRGPTPPARPGTLICGFLVASVALVVLACDAAPSNGPSASPSGSPSNAPTDVPGVSSEPSGGSGEPTQTETEWGRIWDALPVGFPAPPGSTPSEPIGRGPSTAELAVGAGPTEVTDFYTAALVQAGYLTATQGPLENGSRVIDASRGSGCNVQVTVTPLSGVTHVTILFGAGCPFG